MRSGAFDYKLEHDRQPEFRLRVVERPADAASAEGVDDQEAKQRAESREENAFIQAILSNPTGRRFAYKLLTQAKAFETSPLTASPMGMPDHDGTIYKMGQQSIGQMIYQWFAISARKELFELQDEFNVYGGLAMRPEKGAG